MPLCITVALYSRAGWSGPQRRGSLQANQLRASGGGSSRSFRPDVAKIGPRVECVSGGLKETTMQAADASTETDDRRIGVGRGSARARRGSVRWGEGFRMLRAV